MASIGTELANAAERLRPASDSAGPDAEILLAHALGKPRAYLRAWPDHGLNRSLRRDFLALVELRRQGMPVAYLTGSKEFWSRLFKVTPAVLIPRPETELLIELSLSWLPADGFCDGAPERPVRALDLGTGSGNIAVTLALERPSARISACDNSGEALAVARENAETHGVRSISFYQSDWFQAVPEQAFDVIVGNPPYIAPHDRHLNRDGLQFEPRFALCAADDGLAALAAIIENARPHLAENGRLLLEHGYDQAERVQAIFADFGYHSVQTFFDLAGHPRATVGRKSSPSRHTPV